MRGVGSLGGAVKDGYRPPPMAVGETRTAVPLYGRIIHFLNYGLNIFQTPATSSVLCRGDQKVTQV